MLTDDLPTSLERLVALGQMRDVNIRPVLLRVLVDMFVNKEHHADAELLQFEEIVTRLLGDTDSEARLIVADKLSRHRLTPKSLLDRFLAERGAIASKVLASAELDASTLRAAAAFGTSDMALAIAKRRDLDAETARNLADRPESEVLCALAGNPSAPIEGTVFRYLVRRARDNHELAGKLARRDGDANLSAALFLSATHDQRSRIIAAARRQDLGATAHSQSTASSKTTLAAIDRISFDPGLEGLDRELAVALELRSADVDRIMDDRDGEALAIALAACGTPLEVAARIFILGDPAIGRSYARVAALVDIVRTVSAGAARRLILAMFGGNPDALRRRAQPIHDDGQGRRGASPAKRTENLATTAPAEKDARRAG